jgi:hypothetical protein
MSGPRSCRLLPERRRAFVGFYRNSDKRRVGAWPAARNRNSRDGGRFALGGPLGLQNGTLLKRDGLSSHKSLNVILCEVTRPLVPFHARKRSDFLEIECATGNQCLDVLL